jgi:hypothetical protein
MDRKKRNDTLDDDIPTLDEIECDLVRRGFPPVLSADEIERDLVRHGFPPVLSADEIAREFGFDNRPIVRRKSEGMARRARRSRKQTRKEGKR